MSPLPPLKVAANRRYLVRQDGSPFFYLGDTAWELFHRLDRDEAERYLKNRSENEFTVIQAVALAELDGLRTPNANGHLPFENADPARPIEAYWKHVDWIIDRANDLGLYVGLLPTWGDKWNPGRGAGPQIFNAANASAYGRWLGARYRDRGIIWIVGGDRRIENDMHREVIDAMARGLREGDGGRGLITFHPPGGAGSSEWFHDAPWLDFNMRQNGHVAEYTGRYDRTLQDYNRTPVKPVLDGEPIYEDHPISFRATELGHSVAADVRRPLYWNLFGGAFGHTYGHHSVWQMWQPGRTPVNNPLMPWFQALDQPGARQMKFGRRLMESRPLLTRVPDDSIILPDTVTSSVPGAGRYRFSGTRDAGGSYAMVYVPAGRPFRVRMNCIGGPKVIAWWFNPRTGEAARIGEFGNEDPVTFQPPDAGESLDWVLVLDNKSSGYGPPGDPPAR